MSKPFKDSLLASTVLDIFDMKQRMRQGTFNLFLWKNKPLDMSMACTTPGLFEEQPSQIDSTHEEASETSQKNFMEINKLIQRINYYKKKEGEEDNKEWIDKHCNEAIFQQLLQLYLNCEYAMLEVTLPSWPYTVLYMDLLYDDIKDEYIFPKNLNEEFQRKTGLKSQATDAQIFQQLYDKAVNANSPVVSNRPGYEPRDPQLTQFMDPAVMR